MFALIQWQETNEISVLPVHEIKGKGAVVKAKWGNSWHPATILKRSENQEWLESLDVALDGEIISPKRRSSFSSDLLLKKLHYRRQNKQKKTAIKDALDEQHNEILKSPSIFQKNALDDESEAENTNVYEELHETNQDVDEELNENNDELDRNKIEVRRSSDDDWVHKQRKNDSDVNKQAAAKNKKQCFCDQLPSVLKHDIQKLRQILELAKTINNLQNLDEHEVKENYLTAANMNETVELVEGSEIMVNSWKVKSIHNCYQKNPREMVRRLMKLILGEEVLKKSSPTGKNGWTPIPENVYEGDEAFVNLNATRKKYKISHIKYREVLTALCATLRNFKENLNLSLKRKDLIVKPTEVKDNDTENSNEEELTEQDRVEEKKQYGKKLKSTRKRLLEGESSKNKKKRKVK